MNITMMSFNNVKHGGGSVVVWGLLSCDRIHLTPHQFVKLASFFFIILFIRIVRFNVVGHLSLVEKAGSLAVTVTLTLETPSRHF